MPASLRWNRLTIAAEDENEFIAAVFDYFPQLLELPYDELEMDITGTPEISEDAFRSIAIKLIGGEADGKKMLIRIPESVERYFKHANLFRVVDIDVVRPVIRNGSGTDAASVKKKIKAGKFEVAEKKAPAPDATEMAPKPVPESKIGGDKPAKKGAKADVAFLVDAETGTRHEVRSAIMVGREPPSDVVFQIPTISKRHFAIQPRDGQFFIEDMRSTNGTYLNGLPVNEPVPLNDGDEIVVAITLKHPKGARIFQFSTQPA
ncbi:FHA domain-containing protein [Planctomycetota bacterium]|nr:FHA domain-containing protein [Planctomycetota bacterium]